MKKILILLLLCVPGSIWGASKDDIGTKAFSFLKIGLGPRALALGETFTASADDVSSIYWNPAGLSFIKSVQIETGYDMLLESIGYSHVLCGVPLKQYFLGFGISHLRQPGLSTYDEFGNPLGTTIPQDTIVLVSVAKSEEPISIGMTMKYASSRVESCFAHTIAGDVGCIVTVSNIKIALAGQHIGGKIKFGEETETLPITLKGGIATYWLENKKLMIASDVLVPNDNQLIYTGGIEVKLAVSEEKTGALRLGYNSRPQDLDGMAGISAGFGLLSPPYMFDYAWIPYGELGTTHRISLTFLFNIEEKSQKQDFKKRPQKQKDGKSNKRKYLLNE